MGYAFPRARKKKSADLQRHFNMRCMERLGIVLHSDELKKKMQSGELEFVRRQSNTKSHFLIPKDMLPRDFTRRVVAVYDSVRHQFVTVLYDDNGPIYDMEEYE